MESRTIKYECKVCEIQVISVYVQTACPSCSGPLGLVPGQEGVSFREGDIIFEVQSGIRELEDFLEGS